MLFATKKLQLSYLGIVREENPLVRSPRPAQVGVLQVVARPVERPELHVGVAGGGGVPGTPLLDGPAGLTVEVRPQPNGGLKVGQVVVRLDGVGGAQQDVAGLVELDDVRPGRVEP